MALAAVDFYYYYYCINRLLSLSACVAMQILLKELTSQKRTIDKLEDTIEALVKRSGRSWSPLIGRQQEIVSMFIDIQASARERRDELLDRLNEVHCWIFLMMMSDVS